MRLRTPLVASIGIAVLALGLASAGTAAQINLPIDTWVRRPLPPKGGGPCPTGCKHMRLAVSSADGRIYFCGGDYGSNDGNFDSGRQETYSYSIADSSWRLEYPYCGPAGDVQPTHPDEVGWVYDSRRNKFWMVPGYMGQDAGTCTGATQVRYQVMTFDPPAGKWTHENRQELTGVNLGDNGFAQYDPVTDTIIQFFYASCSGVAIYDIATDTWTKKCFSNLPFVSKEYTAMDLQGRVIYVIHGNQNVLYRYDMDAQTIEAISNAPPGAGSTHTRPVWDSVSRVLIWLDYDPGYYPGGGRLHIYHPDTNTWELNRPINQPEGSTVFGSSLVFDPYQNALLAMGSSVDNTPYFYLYRYGNGSGGPPPTDSTPPSPPTNLRPR